MKPFKIDERFRLEIDRGLGWDDRLLYLVETNLKNNTDHYYWIEGRQITHLKNWIIKADKTLTLNKKKKPK